MELKYDNNLQELLEIKQNLNVEQRYNENIRLNPSNPVLKF